MRLTNAPNTCNANKAKTLPCQQYQNRIYINNSTAFHTVILEDRGYNSHNSLKTNRRRKRLVSPPRISSERGKNSSWRLSTPNLNIKCWGGHSVLTDCWFGVFGFWIFRCSEIRNRSVRVKIENRPIRLPLNLFGVRFLRNKHRTLVT